MAIPPRPSVSSPIGRDGQNQTGRTSEGGPTEVLRARLVVWGRNSPPGGGSPIRRTASPASPSAPAADGSGNWKKQPGETRFPSRFPPFSVLFRSSSAFPPMSCLEIWMGKPKFSKRAPPVPALLASIGGSFDPPTVLKGGGESPPPVSLVRCPSPWAPSSFAPIQKSGEAGSPRLPIGAEADGVPIRGNLTRRD